MNQIFGKCIFFLVCWLSISHNGYSQTHTSYTSLYGDFGQPAQAISELTDVLFQADKRFAVTPSTVPATLFGGLINKDNWDIPAATSQTININFTAKSELPAGGFNYSTGYVYLSFYYTGIPASVTGRAKDKNGNWSDLTGWTNISTVSTYALWRGTLPYNNYMTELELTFNAQSSVDMKVTKIECHLNRSFDKETMPAFVSKYIDNKLYTNLSFADGSNTEQVRLRPDGSGFFNGDIAIGTTDPQGYKLAVNGDALFTKIKVKQYSSWPDYVFKNDYSLLPLQDLEQYVREHQHLPEVPSAAETKENGIDIESNQALLLKKIEELTLYIIQQNKEMQELKTEVESLKAATNEEKP